MSDFQQELREAVKEYRSKVKELFADNHPSATIAHAQILDEAIEAITKLIEEQVIGGDFPVDTVAVSFPELVEFTARNNLKAKQRAIVRGKE